MSRQRVDLNLFRVFEAVMLHRSIRGASRDLGVTPSAVSHALARLRQALQDDLFVAGENGMKPTVRALELAPGIRGGLAQLDESFDRKPFLPLESVRTFRIAATEYGAAIVLAPLVSRLAKTAPDIQLRVFPYSRMDVVQHLDEDRIDLVISWFGELPERMRRTAILKDEEAVVVRPGHPLTEAPVTLERLFAFHFLVVELTGTEEQANDGFLDDRGVLRRVWIDRLLIEMGEGERDLLGHVAVSLPHYTAVPLMLRGTDMVATLPLNLARASAERGELVVLDLPYEPLTVQVEAVWHERADHDTGLQWMIGELVDAIRGIS